MIGEIWSSYRAFPGWVQIWVALILVPVNLMSLGFLDRTCGPAIALLAVGAMALNGVIMIAERGFFRTMAWPHVILWTPLVVLIVLRLRAGGAEGGYLAYLWALLAIDLISLVLDYRDAFLWWRIDRGDSAILRRFARWMRG
ncbi:MAG: hypothetical protein ACE5DK_09175 [Paracoccaceae bacterium]